MIGIEKTMAEDLFGSLTREEKQQERHVKVRRNRNLDKLVKGLKYLAEIDLIIDTVNYNGHSGYYDLTLPLFNLLEIKKIRSRDITELSLLMQKFEESKEFTYKSGSYLSACINASKDKNFRIVTSHLDIKPSFIGAFNKGQIIEIDGGAGHHVGYGMEEGIIIVNGNVLDYLGHRMSGGKIVVDDACDRLGHYMRGGDIMVKGNAGFEVGYQAGGGNVNIKGHYVQTSFVPAIGLFTINGKVIKKDDGSYRCA